MLADLKPVVRSNAQRTEAKLAWFSREDLTEFGLPLAEAMFGSISATRVSTICASVAAAAKPNQTAV